MTDIDLKLLAADREYWDSVAPEGAELYIPRQVYLWGRWEGEQEYFYDESEREWLDALVSYSLSTWKDIDPSCIPRPPKKAQEVEWDGDELPPVGCKCEMIHPGIKDFGWQRVVIKAYFDDRVAIKSNPAIWENKGYSAILIDDDLEFRPLRTKEQRLRDELEEDLQGILPFCEYNDEQIKELADILYAQGYRKPEPKP